MQIILNPIVGPYSKAVRALDRLKLQGSVPCRADYKNLFLVCYRYIKV